MHKLDSQHKMLDKYTELDGHGVSPLPRSAPYLHDLARASPYLPAQARRFKKSKATRLSALPPHLEAEVRPRAICPDLASATPRSSRAPT